GARAHSFHHQARRGCQERRWRDLFPLREGRPSGRRCEDEAPLPSGSRRLLRRPPRAPVLQRTGRVHDLGPGDDPGAAGRRCGSQEPRAHGRDEPQGRGCRHDSRGFRGQHRRQCRARLRQRRECRDRSRIFLSVHGRLSAL
ncbi:MAG: Nucleoside diphosphate kinase, partial [uncultured Lysobacter sp.]